MKIAECRAHIFWNIGISATAIKGLVNAGYNTTEDLIRAEDRDLINIRGLGRVGIDKIREFTNTKGIHERIRIDALNKKREEVLRHLKEIDDELEKLYKKLED